jgi:hypothetical protein
VAHEEKISTSEMYAWLNAIIYKLKEQETIASSESFYVTVEKLLQAFIFST